MAQILGPYNHNACHNASSGDAGANFTRPVPGNAEDRQRETPVKLTMTWHSLDLLMQTRAEDKPRWLLNACIGAVLCCIYLQGG
jgi:hypothetical protein